MASCSLVTESASGRIQRRSAFDALPDELLLLVFGQLQQLNARLPGNRGTITSRGSAERVCRRWRRLCLAAFQCTAALHFGPRPGMRASHSHLSALQGIDKSLKRREVVDLQLSGYEPRLLAVLCSTAATTFPSLRRLSLQDTNLSILAGLLPLGQQLQDLSLKCAQGLPAAQWVELAACIGTLSQLRQLDLDTKQTQCGELEIALSELPQLTSVNLKDAMPARMPWLPHLRSLSTAVRCEDDAQRLALAVPMLTHLTHLTICDRYSEDTEEGPLTLPELQSLSALRELRCEGSIPAQVWYCSHLTSLLCYVFDENVTDLPDQLALRCLQRLHLFSGPAHDFPTTLCQLTQLTSLAWMEAADFYEATDGDKALLADFSRLSHLRQLCISHLPVTKASLAPLTALSALTELLLPHCYGQGDCLPRGPYLRNLQVLDISSVDLDGRCPLPPALASAPALHTVAVDWTPMPSRLADWTAIKAALSRVRRLKVLHLTDLGSSEMETASFKGMLALVRDHVCRVVLGDDFRFDRQLCSLASDLQWQDARCF